MTRTDVLRSPLWLWLAAVIGLQISYPLLDGGPRDAVVVTTVVLAAAGVLWHAALTRGVAVAAGVLTVSGGTGLIAEIAGVHTGYPFGSYAYDGRLGPQVADVPVLIALAWTMMAWPAWLVAGRITSRRAPRILIAAWALAAWDVFLDPQMVDARYWHWSGISQHLPGVPTVPLTNFAGWLAVSLVVAVLLAALDRAPTRSAIDTPLLAFYLWTAIGSFVAHVVFLGLAASGWWGALAMGIVAVPLAVQLRRGAVR